MNDVFLFLKSCYPSHFEKSGKASGQFRGVVKDQEKEYKFSGY
jgi:hypothetical protein